MYHLPSYMVLTLLVSALAAQRACSQAAPAGADSLTREFTMGMTQFGATGIFFLESPEVLGVGSIAGCLARNGTAAASGESASYPFSFSLGLATRAEAYASFGMLRTDDRNSDVSTFGLKINSMRSSSGISHISPDLEFVRIQSREGRSDVATVASARLLMKVPLSSALSGYLAPGYRVVLKSAPGAGAGVLGGIGITCSLSEHALIAGEATRGGRVGPAGPVEETVGLKWFFFEHLQCAVALQARQSEGVSTVGFSLGVGFSSGLMRATDPNTDPRREVLPQPPPLEDIPPAGDSASSSHDSGLLPDVGTGQGKPASDSYALWAALSFHPGEAAVKQVQHEFCRMDLPCR